MKRITSDNFRKLYYSTELVHCVGTATPIVFVILIEREKYGDSGWDEVRLSATLDELKRIVAEVEKEANRHA